MKNPFRNFVDNLAFDDPLAKARLDMQQEQEDEAKQERGLAAPAAVSQALQAEPVERGVWIDASAIDSGDATRRTKEFERVVNSFDEDKETFGHWVTHKVISVLCYILPALFAIFGGWAIGDTLSNATTPVASVWFYHLMSVGVELLTPIAAIMTARKVQQAKKDRSLIWLCVILGFAFIVIATLNAFAQEVFLYDSLAQKTTVQVASVWFRAAGPSIFDAIALAYLAAATTKSLKYFMANQATKAAAVGQVAQSAIQLDRAHLQAGIERQQALQDMQSKSRRATTWNEIEAMQAEQMIESARQNMIGNGDKPSNGSGSFRRSSW